MLIAARVCAEIESPSSEGTTQLGHRTQKKFKTIKPTPSITPRDSHQPRLIQGRLLVGIPFNTASGLRSPCPRWSVKEPMESIETCLRDLSEVPMKSRKKLTKSRGREQTKGISPAAKQALVLEYLRKSRTCHTLKDLEKILPSVASINGMQVKDYIQALTDDSKLRVERIGSGNWYWVFCSEERKERERVLSALKKEYVSLDGSVRQMESGIEQAKKKQANERQNADYHESLLVKLEEMRAHILDLKAQESQFLAGGAAALERKCDESSDFRKQAEMWTDNIYILEEYIGKLSGENRETLVMIQREYYGSEYVEGEGLKELEF